MSEKKRREVLLLSSGVLALSGCSALNSSENLHQIELNSDSDDDHTVSVEVLDADGETLFDQSFDLPTEMMNEGIEPFAGDPAEIVVQIDDAEPLRSEWPEYPTELRANETPQTYSGEGCRSTSGETVTGVWIIVIDPSHVGLEPTCETVRR
jgi:hypothetical protein